MSEAQLGSKYRDTITGFVGTATGRATYLHTTPQVQLVAETGNEDTKSHWIEEAQLERVDKQPAGFGGES